MKLSNTVTHVKAAINLFFHSYRTYVGCWCWLCFVAYCFSKEPWRSQPTGRRPLQRRKLRHRDARGSKSTCMRVVNVLGKRAPKENQGKHRAKSRTDPKYAPTTIRFSQPQKRRGDKAGKAPSKRDASGKKTHARNSESGWRGVQTRKGCRPSARWVTSPWRCRPLGA